MKVLGSFETSVTIRLHGLTPHNTRLAVSTAVSVTVFQTPKLSADTRQKQRNLSQPDSEMRIIRFTAK